jgi:hypothetical protein
LSHSGQVESKSYSRLLDPPQTGFGDYMKRYLIKNVSDDIIRSAVKEIIDNGGKVYTDNSFEIEGVKGTFKVRDGMMTITIYDKPWLVSWDLIKETLKQYFA